MEAEHIYKDNGDEKPERKSKKTFYILGGIFIILSFITVYVIASPYQPVGSGAVTCEMNGTETLHCWNEIDDYYFNTTSGIQLTNHIDEYWAHNVFCGGIKLQNEWEYYCNDNLPFTWNMDGDNETWVNLTGYRDVTKTIGGTTYKARFVVRYNLVSNASSLNVIPYVENIGSVDIPVDVGFAWHINQIDINLNNITDNIYVNNTVFALNQSGSKNYTEMTDTFFEIKDPITTEYLWLNWSDSLNYKLMLKGNNNPGLSSVTLGINAGTLAVGQNKSTEIQWIDALCILGCTQNIPSPGVDVGVSETYSSRVTMTYTGTCTGNKIITHQYNNASVWTTIQSGSEHNISLSSGTNPNLNAICRVGSCRHDITGKGNIVGLNYIRGFCEYGTVSLTSGNAYVNVTADTTDPVVTLVTPADETVTTDLNHTFQCDVSDGSGVTNITLWGDFGGQGWNPFITNITDGTSYNFDSHIYNLYVQNNTQDTNTWGSSLPTDIIMNGSNYWQIDFLDKYVYKLNRTMDHVGGWGIPWASLMVGIGKNDSNIFVSDRNADKVYVFDYEGNSVANISLSGINNPEGITANATNFFIINNDESSVQVHNFDGSYVSNFSIGIDADSLAWDDGTIYVGIEGSSIWEFLENGTLEHAIDFPAGDAMNGIDVLCVDDNPTELIALDKYDNEIRRYKSGTVGNYTWNCLACDGAVPSNCASASANYTLNITAGIPAECWTLHGSGLLEIPTECLYETDTLYEVS